MCYGNQTWSEESLMWVYNDDDLHGGQRSSEVKCGKLCAMATKLGQKNPWCEFIMMMTFMEVKGHQRSNVVNYVLWLPNLVRRISDASLWWWWPSWRSKVIRGQMRKLCAMATKLSQKKPWCKFMMMMTFMKVKGHQRLNVVNVGSGGIEKSHSCKWAKWIQWHALPHIQQSTQQRNKGYYPNLHGWDFSIPPLPKCCTLVTKLGQKASLMQVYDDDDLHEGQRSSEVKCGKLCTMVTKLGQQNR